MIRRVETHFGPTSQGPLEPREISPNEYCVTTITPEEAIEQAQATVKVMFGSDACDLVQHYEDGIDGEFEGGGDEGLKADTWYEYPEGEEIDDEEDEQIECSPYVEEKATAILKLKKEVEKCLMPATDPALDNQIELIKKKQKESRKKCNFRRQTR
jgi:hypothetical protein